MSIQVEDYYARDTFNKMKAFADTQETPFVVIDTAMISKAYDDLRAGFEFAKVYYAVKANPAVEIIDLLRDKGSSFDIASIYELDKVMDRGVSPDRISYGNTIKKSKDIRYFYEKGVRLFSTDSEADLRNIAKAAPGAKIYVRILTEGSTTADWPLSRKFGCQTDMAMDLLILARDLGLVPYGISFHVGSQQRDISVWDAAIAKVKVIFERLKEEDGIVLKLINMGGGFPANYITRTNSLETYAEEIIRFLKEDFGDDLPEIILEPGRSLIANAGILVSEVVLVARKSRTAVAVNQGGKRKGAVCAYLETWHMDIEEFIELRKNTGDDRRRTHDMNTANWIPDLFMKRVFDDGPWTLFSPSEVPDLHDLTGKAFEERYEYYEALSQYPGKIKLFKTIQAKDLWRKMLSMLFETGHPWLTFKDPCNLRSPQQHVGVVHSSNLCTEITLNTNKDEIAVCNLGSINLPNHIVDGKLDTAKLKRTIDVAVRMLDNVIDINYYSVPQARNSNFKHRPVGLGIMGFQDALYLQHIPYASQAAVEFADKSMEAVSYFAIQASCDLADERGAYETFQGSLWSKGILPLDSQQILIEQRGQKYIDVDLNESLDWAPVRARVQKGIRNSNIMAIAPTATIANITGVSQSIEPTYQNLYVKSNLSGEFTVINPYLVRDLKARDLWDSVMINDLKYYDGSVQQIERIPQELKELYATAFEVDTKWIVDAASRRQKWIDQAQSLNLYIAGASGKKLDVTYRMAWYRGLKTTYYLRALAATSTEKSTVNTGKLNAVSNGNNSEDVAAAPAGPAPVPKACAIDEPDCEACQ